MASKPSMLLASIVLNDGKLISYRELSRHLKVHNNIAKQMLYEFHQAQNSKKPGSVFATYLLDGVPLVLKESSKNGYQVVGEDVHMQSSPYMSSSMPQEGNDEEETPSRRVILAGEDDLQEARETFDKIRSIHIYSLSPKPVQNLQILSECNRAISAKHISEDLLVVGGNYGVIRNAGVRRRTGKRSAAPLPAAPTIEIPEKASTSAQEATRRAQARNHPEQLSSSGVSATSTPPTESKLLEQRPASKLAPLKREYSDIFKSFSKPESKLVREDTGSSVGASPASTKRDLDTNMAEAEGPMEEASEEEVGNDLVEIHEPKPRKGKSRHEREEELRQMMEDDDDDMERTSEAPAKSCQESELIDAAIPRTGVSPSPPSIATVGRRRGRRKVMKKKTTKDEEGYLVTKEEPAWESFSEDESVVQKEGTPGSTLSSSTAKGKKNGAKPGQGNIMSFFGKK